MFCLSKYGTRHNKEAKGLPPSRSHCAWIYTTKITSCFGEVLLKCTPYERSKDILFFHLTLYAL